MIFGSLPFYLLITDDDPWLVETSIIL